MATPHRVVDGIVDGLAQGAQDVVGSLAGGLKGAGNAVMNAVDKPPQALLHKQGPHRIVDRGLNAGVDAATQFVNQGVIGSVRTLGEGISRALDQPTEEIGLPPDLGGGGPGMPKFELPKFGR